MRTVLLTLSAAVVAATGQAATMLTETYSFSFIGVVDNLGDSPPPGARIGDTASGWISFRTERLDPGTMQVFAGANFCWAPLEFPESCKTPLGTRYEFLGGSIEVAGQTVNMHNSEGAGVTLQDGQLVGFGGHYSSQRRFGYATDGQVNFWEWSPAPTMNPYGGHITFAAFYASPEPGSLALMAGGLLALAAIQWFAARGKSGSKHSGT
jgi:hypothetical protein